MTTQAEMRAMSKSGASEKEMAAHVKASGGYNGVASGYPGSSGNNNTSTSTAPTAPLAAKGPIETRIRGTLGALSKAGQDAYSGSMYETLLDNTLGVFGGHPGQTYGESTAPDYYPFPGAKNDAYETHMRNLGPLDGFTYQMTDAERNSQLDHAFIGTPTTDAQRLAVKEGRVNPTGGLATGDNGNNLNTINSTAPISGRAIGSYTNTTPNSGGNNKYADNYFRAVPDSVFANVVTATNSNGISSPSLTGVPTSYGNSYNAGRQWNSGVFGQQAGTASSAAASGEG